MILPIEVLTRELGPELAAAAMRALMLEAERVRDDRPAVRSMIVFFPADQQREPEWAKGIDPDTPCRYNDIHSNQ